MITHRRYCASLSMFGATSKMTTLSEYKSSNFGLNFVVVNSELVLNNNELSGTLPAATAPFNYLT